MKPKAKGKINEINLTVVGLQHRLTKTKIEKLIDALPLMIELRREPENEFDENAIAVWCIEKPFKEVKIGYIQRVVAADLAGPMDDGKFKPYEAWLSEVEVVKTGVGGEGHVGNLLVKV